MLRLYRMTLTEARLVIVSELRGRLAHDGEDPNKVSGADARKLLDDEARRRSTALVGDYYDNATELQLKRFEEEWERQARLMTPDSKPYYHSFEEIHKIGAKEFGRNWLVMNRLIADTAIYYGFDITSRPVRVALSAIALKVLRCGAVERKTI